MATIDIYDGRSLTEAINLMIAPEPFLTKMFWGTPKYHTTDKIDIEIYDGGAELAQFVNQQEESRLVNKRTRAIQTVNIPRTYERKVFTAQELADFRNVGQIYLADEAAISRQADELIMQELEILKARVLRRREWMAAVGLDTGALSISQTNIAFTVDYLYTSNQKVTLTGADLWSAATTGLPINNIRTWKRAILQRCGISPTAMILGTDAAKAFIENDQVQAYLNKNMGYNAGQLDLSGAGTVAANYLGKVAGVDVYEYTQQIDIDGTATDMIGTDKAILVAKSNDFRMHFAPAYRLSDGGGLNILNQDMLVESTVDRKKTKVEWEVEQKSLPTIHNPNNVISAVVV
jgi:hypothetical protein